MPAYQHHTLDIYGVELYLATDRKQWASLRRKLTFLDKAPEAAGMSHFATWHPKDGGITVPHLVLWFDAKAHRTLPETVDTCAHEAAHAACQVLDWVGHGVKGTDEPHAYLTGFLARWMFERVHPL